MKKLFRILPVAIALTTMTACSTNDDSSEAGQGTAKPVTFEGTAQVADSTTTRGYYTDPGNITLGFADYKWLNDDIIKVMLATAEPFAFLADGFWDASVSPSSDGTSANISWAKDLTIANSTAYKQLFVSAPSSTSTIDNSGQNTKSVTYNLPATTTDEDTKVTVIPYTQTGNSNMDHLKPYYFIYSSQSITSDASGKLPKTDLIFNFIPAIMRFAVGNLTGQNITVNSVEIVLDQTATSGFSPFRTSFGINFSTWSKGASVANSITSYDKSIGGMKVSVSNATPIANKASARFYGLIPPYTSTAIQNKGQNTYTFYVNYTDASNHTYYVAATIDALDLPGAAKINSSDYYYYFKSGSCYTFKLTVKDQLLTVEAMAPTTNPFGTGWADDAEMTNN